MSLVFGRLGSNSFGFRGDAPSDGICEKEPSLFARATVIVLGEFLQLLKVVYSQGNRPVYSLRRHSVLQTGSPASSLQDSAGHEKTALQQPTRQVYAPAPA